MKPIIVLIKIQYVFQLAIRNDNLNCHLKAGENKKGCKEVQPLIE